MRTLLLLFFISIQWGGLFAQGGEIDLREPDFRLLEMETFHAVNDLRKDNKISALLFDDILYRAAKDHAQYLIKEKSLSHDQRIADKRTPFKRVMLHGGQHFDRVGENLVAVQLGVVIASKGKKLSTQSYNSAARTMAEVWRASPPHYRNILNKAFNVSAIATAYDSVTQRLVAVQVFGLTSEQVDATEQPDHSSALLELPAKKLPYNLKESPRISRNEARSIRAFMKLKNTNGYLCGSYKQAKRAFKGRRSGIAVEYIPLSQYDSGAKEFAQVRNRRTGLFALNGELSKPVYRREMLRYSRKASRPRRVWVNLVLFKIYKKNKSFCYPVSAGSGTNQFLIHKRKLVTYTTPLALPSALLHKELPSLKFKSSFDDLTLRPRYRKETRSDTVEVKVFYNVGEVKMDSTVLNQVRGAIENINGKVVRVEASAFASVDGDMAENQTLAQQRADEFMLSIAPHLDTVRVTPVVKGKEQWDLFLKQIEYHRLSHLRNMHKRDLRNYVNAHKNDSLISRLLAEQRFTLFKMVVRHDTIIALPSEKAVEKYYIQKKKFQSLTKRTPAQAAILEQAQLKAYAEMIADGITDTLSIVRSELFPAFQYHELMFNYIVRGTVSDSVLFESFQTLGEMRYFPSKLKQQMVYNNLVLIYKHLDDSLPGLDPEELYCTRYRKSKLYLRHYKRLRCWNSEKLYHHEYYLLKEIPQLINRGKSQRVVDFPANDLMKFYTTSMIEQLYELAPLPTEIFPHVARVKSLFHPDDNQLSLYERWRLALFYCAFNKTDVARSLIEPVLDDPLLPASARKLFITLKAETFKQGDKYVNYLMDQYPTLGNKEWCSLLTQGTYLTYILFENMKLKKFYNCKCQGDDE